MLSNGFTADGLIEAANKISDYSALHPGAERTWFAQRIHCAHDLQHALTGYGQDPAGEMAIAWFLFPQHHTRLRLLRLGMWAPFVVTPWRSLPRAFRFALRARKRGQRAQIPLSYRWEEALPRSLAEVQRELHIEPTKATHPKGVLRGEVDSDAWNFNP